MPYRINGIGTTISPVPGEGNFSVSMLWFTFLFIPIVPLGWRLIKGARGSRYHVIKRLTYAEVRENVGVKGLWLTVAFGYASGFAMLFAFGFAIFFLYLLRNAL